MADSSVLVVAGLDPSGGAGLLADVTVVAAHGFHAAGVATALTEQDSAECARMHPVSPEVVARQIARLVADLSIRAVKVGMLGTAEIAHAVAETLRPLRVPIVVDPVLKATHGVALLDGDPGEALAPLLAQATLVTPNADELAALTHRPIATLDDLRAAARLVKSRGAAAVLAKGGHLPGDPIDLLVDQAGELELPGKRVAGTTPHGTGCALSTEIACRLAQGTPLRDAVRSATARLRERIAAAHAVGRGRPFLG